MARGPLYWSFRNFGWSDSITPASVRTMLSLMKEPMSAPSLSRMSKAGLKTSRKCRMPCCGRLGAERAVGLGVLGVDVALVGEGHRIEAEVGVLPRLVDSRGAVVPRWLFLVAAAARRPDVGGVVEADRRGDRAPLEEALLRQPLAGRGRHQHDVDEAGPGHVADVLKMRRPRREARRIVGIGHRRRAAEADVAVLGVGDDEIGGLVGAGLDGSELLVEGSHGDLLGGGFDDIRSAAKPPI